MSSRFIPGTWLSRRVAPGGESVAIAAGMSPLDLGTDLAISVWGPAAHTGIVSLKAPTDASP